MRSLPRGVGDHLLHAAQRDERLPTGLVGCHAGAQVVVDVQLEMALDLGGQVALEAVAGERGRQAHEERA